jgi:hypothetical protein
MLRDLIRPPWTLALVDLLLFYDRLEREREAELEELRASSARTQVEELFRP